MVPLLYDPRVLIVTETESAVVAARGWRGGEWEVVV